MKAKYGIIVLFGSGEISPTGRAIHRRILGQLSGKAKVAILETPAGFQPNTHLVAKEIAGMFETSLNEFVESVTVIPARKKGTFYSPDNPRILEPLAVCDYIFIGPGSPTYAVKQLRNSLALAKTLNRFRMGAVICLSSAGALAAGEYTLPVYEIYKAGADLFWERGLDIFKNTHLSLTVITHWNNREGGKTLDTGFCFMGKDRFGHLQKLLPQSTAFLGIDEQTAAILDFSNHVFYIEGTGNVYLVKENKIIQFYKKHFYHLESLKQEKIIEIPKPDFDVSKIGKRSMKNNIKPADLPEELKELFKMRNNYRESGEFGKADEIRNRLKKKGYEIRDSAKGELIIKND